MLDEPIRDSIRADILLRPYESGLPGGLRLPPESGAGKPPVGFKITRSGPAYGWLMSLGWEPDAMAQEFELGVQSAVADALAGVARFAAVAGTGSPPATELRPRPPDGAWRGT